MSRALVMGASGFLGSHVVQELAAAGREVRIADTASFFTRRDNRLSAASIRCSSLLPNVDSARARRELDWRPRPIEAFIAEAVDCYLANP